MNAARTVVLLGLFAVGCAGATHKDVRVTGRLTQNGSPLRLAEGETVTITFLPADKDQGTSYGAEFNPDTGTFEVLGPLAGRGIPPGKYRIAITTSIEEKPDQKRFREAFNEVNTPLEYEVTAAPEQNITVDVGARTVLATQ